MSAERTVPVTYPLISENEARNGRLERISQTYINLPKLSFSLDKPVVQAAGILHENSTTEIINVNILSQRNTSVIRNSVVEIIETGGRLFAKEYVNPCSWLKIITLATDSQSHNVLLAISSGGLILKTTRNILSGEPLLMWFDDSILSLLNIPFIRPVNCNFQGSVSYRCHICSTSFEYPNPLKLHLALDCDRMDTSYIWTLLSSKIVSPMSSPFFSQYPRRSFTFELNSLPAFGSLMLPVGSTSHAAPRRDTGRSLRNDSPCSSNEQSPPSSKNPSPISPYPLPEILPSTYESRIGGGLISRHSASRPYWVAQRPDLERMDPADVERIASDMGKCGTGYKCIFCGKVYSRKYGLRIHIRTHNGYKPLQCRICARRFGDPSNLNKHVRLHATDDSPYKCGVCGKVLVRRRDLERHINSRHNLDKSDVSVSSSSEIDGDQ